jgi:hypothetical protein
MSINFKSTEIREAQDHPLFPSAALDATGAGMCVDAADAAPPLLAASPEQRIEQMYELAEIFASIFEALQGEHEHAIATTREAA